MTTPILVVGTGVLADTVGRLFTRKCLKPIFMTEVPAAIPENVHFALVLDDAWHPSLHAAAQETFGRQGIPWLRGFVAFGNGFVGPLVCPGKNGCFYCADTRLVMAETDRRPIWQLRLEFTHADVSWRDVWATKSGLYHMAHILVSEVERGLKDEGAYTLANEMVCVNLRTLATSRHFVLPNAACPICGSVPHDSAESAVLDLTRSPKVTEHSYRSRTLAGLEDGLAHDYLDSTTGLLNARVQDLVTPFAAASVNLPLMMGDEGASGRAHSYPECEPIAILEALERFCGLEPRGKQSVVFDSYANLKDVALNPTTVGLHDSEQYLNPRFPFQPFRADTKMEWMWAYSLTEERPILVPKRFAYYSLPCQDGFIYETSNGCALGSTYVEAIFHGILEVVERDAFLMTWYAKLPLPAIDVTGSKDRELQWMIHRIRYVAGYNVHLYNATMENGIPTVFVIAKNQRHNGLNLLCSAGAHLDSMRAIKGAIQETAGMLLRFDEKLEAEREVYKAMLQDGNLVTQMEQHSMLYGLPEAEQRLDFLLQGKRKIQTLEEAFSWNTRHPDLAEDLRDVLSVFKRLQLDVIVVDQTSPELLRSGFHCVKVIIPGMLPMTFGQQFRRLEHLERVLTVPMRLGYRKRPLSRTELNPYPHPFP